MDLSLTDMNLTLKQIKQYGNVFLINGHEVDLDIESSDDGFSLYAQEDTEVAVFRSSHKTWVCNSDIKISLDSTGSCLLELNVEDGGILGSDPETVSLRVMVSIPLNEEYLTRILIGVIQ